MSARKIRLPLLLFLDLSLHKTVFILWSGEASFCFCATAKCFASNKDTTKRAKATHKASKFCQCLVDSVPTPRKNELVHVLSGFQMEKKVLSFSLQHQVPMSDRHGVSSFQSVRHRSIQPSQATYALLSVRLRGKKKKKPSLIFFGLKKGCFLLLVPSSKVGVN